MLATAFRPLALAGRPQPMRSRPAPQQEPVRPAGVPASAAARNLPTLAQIYAEHAGRVARWAARLGGPDVEVEDVLQEVFIIAHRQLPGFRGDAQLSTWLFAITRNVVRQRGQRERVRRFFLSAASRESTVAPGPMTPMEDAERRESMQLVYRVLGGMPEKYRTAFVLFEIEGMSGQEASELTGVKVSTLRVWLLRARAHFERRFERLTRGLPPGDAEGGDHE